MWPVFGSGVRVLSSCTSVEWQLASIAMSRSGAERHELGSDELVIAFTPGQIAVAAWDVGRVRLRGVAEMTVRFT